MIIRPMKYKIKRPPVYGDRAIKLALEFGMLLSESAKDLKMTLTPEIVTRAENIFIQEVRENGLDYTAMNFTPLLLSAYEV